MPDEVEDRAREFIEQINWNGGGYRPTNGQEPRFSWLLAQFAQQEAQHERIAACRELIENSAGRILKLDAEPITAMEDVFREMFPDSEL